MAHTQAEAVSSPVPVTEQGVFSVSCIEDVCAYKGSHLKQQKLALLHPMMCGMQAVGQQSITSDLL